MAFGIDDVLAAGLSIVNKLIPDPAQRAAAELELFKAKQAGEFRELEARLEEMKQLTDRQRNDMASDSWLSKNIRPGIMIYFLVLITCMGFGLITAGEKFMAMIQSFTEYGLIFYFGGRTIEKVASMVPAILEAKTSGGK